MSVSAESGTSARGTALQVHARVVLPDFTLEVQETLEEVGVTALFGASGSGKTTLLRAIAGFEKPVRGRITLGGSVFFDHERGIDVPPHRRPVGFLFQDARLFEHLDVSGNLDFAARRRGGADERFDRQAVVDALDLSPLLARRVAALSGGERQRVALGRTLLAGPALLLLDEPLAALDAGRKAEILPFLEEVTRRFRIPTLFVSHDVDEVVELADRVLVLADGQVRAEGPTAEIVEHLDLSPITGRREAGVLVEGRVARHDERLHLTLVDLDGDELTLPLASRFEPGDSIRLRVMAQDVAIAVERPRGLSIRNVLPGRITNLRFETEGAVDATIQLRAAHLRSRLTQAAVEDLGLEEGSEVFALVKSVSLDRGRETQGKGLDRGRHAQGASPDRGHPPDGADRDRGR